MAWKNHNSVSLSKSILEMKFMKRTKDKVEKEQYQQEGEEYFGRKNLPKFSGRYITEASYAFCEELIEGRLSFQGENPELERLIELEQMEKSVKIQQNNEVDVSDAQMAEAWKARTKINVKNMNTKHGNNDTDLDKEPTRKKPKYLKPADD